MSVDASIIGFECVFAKKADIRNFFRFSNIELDHYYFSVADAAVFSQCKRVEILEKFQPSYFQELIQMTFTAERLVLHLYPGTTDSEEIDTYEDFLKSNCEMIILLYDFYYMEVYCKNQLWLNSLMQTAMAIPNAVVEKKYEHTDTRTSMYV